MEIPSLISLLTNPDPDNSLAQEPPRSGVEGEQPHPSHRCVSSFFLVIQAQFPLPGSFLPLQHPSPAPASLGILPAPRCPQNCSTQAGKVHNSKINGVHLVNLLQTPFVCLSSTSSANNQRAEWPWLAGGGWSITDTAAAPSEQQAWPLTAACHHSPGQLIPHSPGTARSVPALPFLFEQQLPALRGQPVLPAQLWFSQPPLKCWFVFVHLGRERLIWRAQVMGEFRQQPLLLIFHISTMNWRWSFHCLPWLSS